MSDTVEVSLAFNPALYTLFSLSAFLSPPGSPSSLAQRMLVKGENLMLSSPLLLPFLQSREGKGRADSVNASVCTTASCFQVFSVYDAFLKWKCGSASPDAVWVYHDPGVGGGVFIYHPAQVRAVPAPLLSKILLPEEPARP